MIPVPLYQVVDFLDWLHSTHPDARPDDMSDSDLRRLAFRYLTQGYGREFRDDLLRLIREGREADPSRVLEFILRVFQSCPMIEEGDIRSQMRHFAKCGRCLHYVGERRSSAVRSAALHPFLGDFMRSPQARELTHYYRYVHEVARLDSRDVDPDLAFHSLMEAVGPQLLMAFEQYISDERVARDAEAYVRERREPTGREREDGSGEFMPINSNEHPEQAAQRLVDGVRYLSRGDVYRDAIERDPQAYRLMLALGIVEENIPQAIEFIAWLQMKHGELDLLGSIPTAQVRELVAQFCEEKNYGNAASFTRDVLGWFRGQAKPRILKQLDDLGERIKRRNRTYKPSVSPFERYRTITYHAMFLFLSAGDFPAFIEKYWQDLNHLTGDYVDVYYSFEDIQRRTSGYAVLEQFRTLEVEATALPALLLWKDNLTDSHIIPLQRLSHDDVFDVVKLVVQRIRDGADLHEICAEALYEVESRTEALLPGPRITITGGITMGDKIEGGNVNFGGIQNVGKFRDVSNTLVEAGNQDLAVALADLRKAIADSQHLSDAEKQEHEQTVTALGEEAAKPKPSRPVIKALGAALEGALKAIPDVAKAVVALLPLLDRLLK